MICKNCGSNRVVKHGLYRSLRGLYQMHKCKNCGKTMKGGRLA